MHGLLIVTVAASGLNFGVYPGFGRHLVGKTLRNVCYSVVTFVRFFGRLMIVWTFS